MDFSTHRGIWIKVAALQTFSYTTRLFFLFIPNIFTVLCDLFLQNIWPFQSSIWVAACQNWLPVHFPNSVHIWRLSNVAVTQWGKKMSELFDCWLNSSESLWFSHIIKARWPKEGKEKEPLKCLWCIIHHRAKYASWEWKESSKNWKQTFDVSRPEISIFPRCQTPAHVQRKILSGEFHAPQLLFSLH